MRNRLEWLEYTVKEYNPNVINIGKDINGNFWFVDVDKKTGIAYGYIADDSWIQDGDLPNKP